MCNKANSSSVAIRVMVLAPPLTSVFASHLSASSHSQSSLGRGLAPAHQVMGTAAGMSRRKEKGLSLLGEALQRMTGEKEACSSDLPRAAALFLGPVDSEEKERVPGHVRSSSSDTAHQQGNLPWLPKLWFWD